jgi:hypothetical protein
MGTRFRPSHASGTALRRISMICLRPRQQRSLSQRPKVPRFSSVSVWMSIAITWSPWTISISLANDSDIRAQMPSPRFSSEVWIIIWEMQAESDFVCTSSLDSMKLSRNRPGVLLKQEWRFPAMDWSAEEWKMNTERRLVLIRGPNWWQLSFLKVFERSLFQQDVNASKRSGNLELKF